MKGWIHMKNSYGFDRLSRDMLMLAVIIGIISFMLWGSLAGMILCFSATFLTALVLFRTLSNNFTRRSDELRGYERITGSIHSFFAKLFNRSKNDVKTHKMYKYFHCPSCRQKLRVPRGKGKIRVTCSKCGTQFEKRT